MHSKRPSIRVMKLTTTAVALICVCFVFNARTIPCALASEAPLDHHNTASQHSNVATTTSAGAGGQGNENTRDTTASKLRTRVKHEDASRFSRDKGNANDHIEASTADTQHNIHHPFQTEPKQRNLDGDSSSTTSVATASTENTYSTAKSKQRIIVKCKQHMEHNCLAQINHLVDEHGESNVRIVHQLDGSDFFAIQASQDMDFTNIMMALEDVEDVEDDPVRQLFVPNRSPTRSASGGTNSRKTRALDSEMMKKHNSYGADEIEYVDRAHAMDATAANSEMQSESAPKPQSQSIPYGVTMVRAPELWASSSKKGEGARVCIMDSGLVTHVDINQDFVVGGIDLGSDGDYTSDGDGHGTHVAGTIAAADNGIGVVGVAPHAELYIVRVFADNGEWYASDVVAAVNACLAANVDIINMSLGGRFSTNSEEDAFQRVRDRGVLSVASAGNSGTSQYLYPASYDSVVSVAAVSEFGTRAYFSTMNDAVNLAAPGVAVESLANDGYSTVTYDGTSMACPHVVGVAALLKSIAPDATNDEIRAAMEASAIDKGAIGKDNEYGYGVVDAVMASIYLVGCDDDESQLAVTFVTDRFGSDTTWYLTDEQSGDEMLRDSNLPSSSTVPYLSCVPKTGCYTVTIEDSYGDGICCGVGQGSFQVYLDDVLKFSGGDFQSIAVSPQFGEGCSGGGGGSIGGGGGGGSTQPTDPPVTTPPTANPPTAMPTRGGNSGGGSNDVPACNNNNEIELLIDINTDEYGEETSYEITKDGTLFKAKSGFPNSSNIRVKECVPNDGCYQLTVMDSNDDGMCCSSGFGSIHAYFDGERVFGAMDFKSKARSKVFGESPSCHGS